MNAPISSSNNTTSGAVLVVGGGVAGVQAALDLSALGFKVYLVEKSGAIGGVMARLDKTFPTNDCSLCINPDRFLIEWASAAEGPNFVKIITAFTERIAALGPLGQAEGKDPQTLRRELAEAAEAARGRKLRTGLINASKEMMKSRDFSRPAIAGLVHDKCAKALEEFTNSAPVAP